MKRCTGIEFLNQCEHSVLCENGFGCKYERGCDFQRPKITAHNSDYMPPSAQSCEACLNIGSETCNKCIRNPYATDMFETVT